MWRTGAVISMLVEEVAGLARADAVERSPAAAVAAAREALGGARRRARVVVGLEIAAIVALVTLSDPLRATLTLGPGEQAVFTLAILAVAVHAGFRLGQLDKLGAVDRLVSELAGRDDDTAA